MKDDSNNIESMLAMAKGTVNEVANKKKSIKESRINILLNILHYINVVLHKFQPLSIITLIILLSKWNFWTDNDILLCAYMASVLVFIAFYFAVFLILYVEVSESVIPFKRKNIIKYNYNMATVISIIFDIFSIIALVWLNVLIGRS